MEQQGNDPAHVWHEQSAIWEIIAGELVVQHDESIADDATALISRARERADQALQSHRADNPDGAGHALIGCSLASAMAARHDGAASTPALEYGGELAAAVSWQAAAPSEAELEALCAALANRDDVGTGASPTLWELAVRAGAFAAGLSPQITRRRQRRDLLTDAVA